MKMLSIVVAIALVFAGCSKPSTEELAAKAKEASEAKNYPLAIEHLARIVQDYPESATAESSMFAIGAIRSNETHEYAEAINAYREYLGRFPNGQHAAEAMFLVGYIYNNDLHALDSAAQAYRMFLAAYPDHPMAQSAQFELDNLGKSPEDLLPKDVVAERPVPRDSRAGTRPRGTMK